MWEREATRQFLDRVYALVEGATLLGGAKGVWKVQVETTHLVRVVVRREHLQLEDVLPLVREAIDEMMRAWAASSADRQDSFMFTARELTVYDARMPHTGGHV